MLRINNTVLPLYKTKHKSVSHFTKGITLFILSFFIFIFLKPTNLCFPSNSYNKLVSVRLKTEWIMIEGIHIGSDKQNF